MLQFLNRKGYMFVNFFFGIGTESPALGARVEHGDGEPRAWSASASCSIGLMWPWNGSGNTRTRRGRRRRDLRPPAPVRASSWTPAIAVVVVGSSRHTASSTGTSRRSTQGLKTESSRCLCLICRPNQSCHQEMIQLLRMSYLCVLSAD